MYRNVILGAYTFAKTSVHRALRCIFWTSQKDAAATSPVVCGALLQGRWRSNESRRVKVKTKTPVLCTAVFCSIETLMSRDLRSLHSRESRLVMLKTKTPVLCTAVFCFNRSRKRACAALKQKTPTHSSRGFRLFVQKAGLEPARALLPIGF